MTVLIQTQMLQQRDMLPKGGGLDVWSLTLTLEKIHPISKSQH